MKNKISNKIALILLSLATSLQATQYSHKGLVFDNIVDDSLHQSQLSKSNNVINYLSEESGISVLDFSGDYDLVIDGAINLSARQDVSQTLFANIDDNYDFLVVFTTFPVESNGLAAFATLVQNDVQGIGKPIFNNANQYGSEQLTLLIDMKNIHNWSFNPGHQDFEFTLDALMHEIMHRWGVSVQYLDTNSQPSNALLDGIGGHWGYFTQSNASIMYGSLWEDLQNGSFKTTKTLSNLSPLDLYLAGFLPATSVPDFFLIENANQGEPSDLPPSLGTVIQGTRYDLSVNDIIAAEGLRIPDHQNSQHAFNVKFALLKHESEDLSDQSITQLNLLQKEIRKRFLTETNGLGELQFDNESETLIPGNPQTLSYSHTLRPTFDQASAIAFLLGHQNSDGSWSDKPATQIRDTALAIQTLTAINEGVLATEAATQWLNNISTEQHDELAWMLLSNGLDVVRSQSITEQLVDAVNEDGGWGIDASSQSSPLDTALVLWALKHALGDGFEPSETTKHYIEQNLSDTNGMGVTEQGKSSLLSSALLLNTFHDIFLDGTSEQDLIDFLLELQQIDGSFGVDSTIHETSLVIQALISAHSQGQSQHIEDARNFLISNQSSNGSFQGSVFSTALALNLLAGSQLPNLSIIDTNIPQTSLYASEIAEINFTIKNSGDQNIDTVHYVIYREVSGEFSEVVAVGSISNLEAARTEFLQEYIPTNGLSGQQNYQIMVDYYEELEESNEQDNTVLFSLNVEPSPSQSELAIQPGSLQFSPLTFNTVPFEVEAAVDVINLSTVDVTAVDVSLLQLDEFDNETVVSSQSIDLMATQQQTVNFNASITESEEKVRLIVRVDQQNQYSEPNENNNSHFFDIQRGDSVDLEILETDVDVSLNGVVGNTQNITFDFRNRGTQPSSSFEVEVTVNDEVLYSQNITGMAAGETLSRNFNWTPSVVGEYEIRFNLDMDNDVPESNENNNVISQIINVQSNALTNLTIGADDISISPDPGLQGQNLTIDLIVHNTSDVDSGSFELNLYQQRDGEQSQLITTLNGQNIAARSSETLQWTINQMTEKGELNFVADIDPNHLIAEYDENDNSNKNLFRILSKPDALVSPGGFALSPSVPVLGQSLDVAVSISNLGEQNIGNLAVNLYTLNSTASTEQLMGTQTINQITAGQTEITNFQFTFPNDPQIDELIVRVDESDNINESNENNNQATRSISSQNARLYVTEKNISPNGDGRKDQTQIIFNLHEVSTYQLSIHDDQNQLVREFAPFANTRFGDVFWDGKNDQGLVVKDGQYQVNLTGNDVNELTNIWIDTNNSPLLDALAVGDGYATPAPREPVEGLSLSDCHFSIDNKHRFCTGTQRIDNVNYYSIQKVKNYGLLITSLITQTSWMDIKAVLPSDQLLITENEQKIWYLFTPSSGQKTLLFDGSEMEKRRLSIIRDDYIVLGPQGYDDPLDDNVIHKIYLDSVRPAESLQMPEYQHEIQLDANYLGVNHSSNWSWDIGHNAYNIDNVEGGWLLYYPLSPVWFIPENNLAGITQISEDTFLHTNDDYPALQRINITADKRKFIVKTDNSVDYFVMQNNSPILKFSIELENFEKPLYEGSYQGFYINPEKSRIASLSPDGFLLLFKNEVLELYSPEGNKLYDFNHGYDEEFFKSLLESPPWWWWGTSLADAAAFYYEDSYYESNYISYNYDFIENERLEYTNFNIHWVSNSEAVFAFSPQLKADIGEAILTDGYWNNYGDAELIGGKDMFLSVVDYLPYWALAYKINFTDPSEVQMLEITETDVEFWEGRNKATELNSHYFLLGDGIYRKNDNLLSKIDNEANIEDVYPLFYENHHITDEFDNHIGKSRDKHYPQVIKRASDQVNGNFSQIHHSTQNLTAYLKSKRIANGFELSGLIFDRNLAYYTLEWADVTSPNQWNHMTTGYGNQFDEVLINWVPPVEGAYHIRLTAHDTAGNKDSDKISVRIGSVNATITNPDVQPRLFSPNGDGIKDDVAISYDVAQATTVTVNIEDRFGNLVKTYSNSYATGGASEQLVWDGRDDSGVLLEDGVYTVDIQGFRYEMTLDTQPPNINFYQREPRIGFDPFWGFVRYLGFEGTIEGIFNSSGQLKKIRLCDLYLYIERYDESLNQWVDDLGCFYASPDNLEKFNGQKYRLTYTDEAGNQGVSPIVTFDYGKSAEQAVIVKVDSINGLVHGTELWEGSERPAFINPEDDPKITDWNLSETLGVAIQAFTNDVVASVVVSLSYDFTDPQTGQTNQRHINVPSQLADLTTARQYFPAGHQDINTQAPGMFFLGDYFFGDLSVYLLELNRSDFPETNSVITVNIKLNYENGSFIHDEFDIQFDSSTSNHKFEPITISQEAVYSENKPMEKQALQHVVDNLATSPQLEYAWYFNENPEPILNSVVEARYFDNPDVIESYLPVLEHSTTDYLIQVYALRDRKCEGVNYDWSGFTKNGQYLTGPDPIVFPADRFCPQINVFQNYFANDYCDSQAQINEMAEIEIRGGLTQSSTPPVSIELYQELSPGNLVLLHASTDIEVVINDGERSFQKIFLVDTTDLANGYHKLWVRAADIESNVKEEAFALLVQKQTVLSQINQPQEFNHYCVAGEEGSGLAIFVDIDKSDPTPHFVSINQLVNGVMTRVPNPVILPNAIVTIDDGSGPVHIVDENNMYAEVLPEINYQDLNDVESTLLYGLDFYRGNLLLDMPPVSDGVSLIFETLNTAGISQCSSVTFTVDSLVEGDVRFTAEKHYLSPNNDGVLDWIDYAEIEVLENVSLLVELWDGNPLVLGQGTLLGEIEQHQLAAGAEIDLRWDGRLAGQLQPESNQYYIRVLLKDDCGVYREVATPVSLDLTPPALQFIEPQASSALATINEIVAEIEELNYGQTYLDYQVNGVWTPIEIIESQHGQIDLHEINAVWNLAQLENNTYTLRLASTDLAGNSQTSSIDLNYSNQQNLFWDYQLSEFYISPNGDGVQDGTDVIFGLNTSAQITARVFDQAGNEVRTLLEQQLIGQGSHTSFWDGLDNQNQVVIDGIYVIETTAIDAADQNNVSTLSLSLHVDTTQPVVTWSVTDNSVIKGESLLSLNLLEQNPQQLTGWRQQLDPLSQEVQLLQTGVSGQIDLLDLVTLPEARHQARVLVTDRAGNSVQSQVQFTIDNTVPEVLIISPQSGSYWAEEVNILAQIEDNHFESYQVFAALDTPQPSWQMIHSGNQLDDNRFETIWPVYLDDGQLLIKVLAIDQAGWQSEVINTIIVDREAPIINIQTPTNQALLGQQFNIEGSITDVNLQLYKIRYRESNSNNWQVITSGTEEKSNELIYDWQNQLSSGEYQLQITAQDQAGHVSTEELAFRIDGELPSAPQHLLVELFNNKDAHLSWSPVTAIDLAGYHIYRNGQRITTAPLNAISFVDAGLNEGEYSYWVVAIDQSGNISEPSNIQTIYVDQTPPDVLLITPANGQALSGQVDVLGTAHSHNDFAAYKLHLRLATEPAPGGLVHESPQAITAGVLFELDTYQLIDGGSYVLTLAAIDLKGNSAQTSAGFTVDNTAPATPLNLTYQLQNGNDVMLNWSANSESDLAGYLVYRNDQIISGNGDQAVIQNATSDNHYADLDRPDGDYVYFVVAIDLAGNVSGQSNSVSLTIDAGAPSVEFVSPGYGSSFDQPLDLLVGTDDQDIAEVRFYHSPTTSGWMLFDTVTSEPYQTTVNPIALGLNYGNVYFRAVAEDHTGRQDLTPPQLRLNYRDMTAPDPVINLTAHVLGGDIQLNWDASDADDLQDYQIKRSINGSTPVFIDTDVLQNSYLDVGLDDGEYYYEIVAVDTANNRSEKVTSENLTVYTLDIEQPFSPVLIPAQTQIKGQTHKPDAIDMVMSHAGSLQNLPPLAVDGSGAFRTEVIDLELGLTSFTGQQTDTNGNQSKAKTVGIEVSPIPLVPTNQQVAVNGFELSYTWDDVVDSFGYLPYHNGEPFQDVERLLTGLTFDASSNASNANYILDEIYQGYQYWSPSSSDRQDDADNFVQINFDQPRWITGTNIFWNVTSYGFIRKPSHYQLQYHSNVGWVTLATIENSSVASDEVNHLTPYLTDKVRILMPAGISAFEYVELIELEINHQPVVTSNQLTQIMSDGHYELQVSSINNYGFESALTDVSTIDVGDVIAPEAVNLSGSTNAGDNLLQWTASVSTDVEHYRLFRNSEIILISEDNTLLEYIDSGLPNGSYSYKVQALDAAGNASVFSNEVTLEVEQTLLAAPENLQVTPVIEGSALQLTWDPHTSNQLAYYQIYRSLTATADFVVIKQLSDPEWLDEYLQNGTEYFYQITAVDAFGNESPFSAVASGIPEDRSAPQTPVILSPTVSGVSITIPETTSQVGGTAGAGQTVDLYVNNAYQQSTIVSTEFQLMEYAGLPYNYGILFNPQRDYYAMFDNGQWLKLVNHETEETFSLENFQIYNNNPYFWSYEGEQLYAVHNETSPMKSLSIFDLQGQLIETVLTARDIREVEVSTAGSYVYYTQSYYDSGAGTTLKFEWIYDTVSQTQIEVDWPIEKNWTTVWIDDKTLVFINGDTSSEDYLKITSYNVENQSFEVLSDQVIDNNYSYFAWSPVSQSFVYSLTINGFEQLEIFNQQSNRTVPLTLSNHDLWNPTFSPDGSYVFTFATDNENYNDWFVVFDASNGNVVYIEQSDDYGDSATWHESGDVYIATTGFFKLKPPGQFNFESVALRPGVNQLYAQSRNQANVYSAYSAPIEIVVQADHLSDLTIEPGTLSINPANGLSGTSFAAVFNIHNPSATDVPAASVLVQLLNPEGEQVALVSAEYDYSLAAGQSTAINVPLGELFEVGEYTFVVRVDHQNEVVEFDETNNQQLQNFVVYANYDPIVTANLSSSLLLPGEPLEAALAVFNPGVNFNGQLLVSIVDASYYPVGFEQQYAIEDLASDASWESTFVWPAENMLAGDYKMKLQLTTNQGAAVAYEEYDFSINAAAQILLETQTNAHVIEQGETLQITSMVEYLNGNSLETGELSWSIVDDAQQIIWSQSEGIPLMSVGYINHFNQSWLTSTPGEYQLLVELNTTLVNKTNVIPFEVVPQGEYISMQGNIQNNSNQLLIGQLNTMSFSITNHSNVALSQIPLTLSLMSADLSATLIDESFVHDFAVGETVSFNTDWLIDGLALDNYLLVLSADLQSVLGQPQQILDTKVLTVIDAGNPVVEVITPVDQQVVNKDVLLRFRAYDELSSLETINLSVNGIFHAELAVSGLGEVYEYWLFDLEEGAHILSIQATDIYGNSSTETWSIIVDTTAPAITVSGVEQGAIYNTGVQPVITVNDVHLSTYSITLDGNPFTSNTLIEAEGVHLLVINATDLAGNQASLQLSFYQDFTAPEIVVTYPATGTETVVALTPVTGTTERDASVYITVGTYQNTATAGPDGAFHFEDVPLSNGSNTIELQATDLAGNQGNVVSVEVLLLQQIEVSGQITAPDSHFIGQALPFDYSLTNLNASEVNALPTELLVINDLNQEVVLSHSTEISLQPNGVHNDQVVLITDDLEPRDYRIVLQNLINGSWQVQDTQVVTLLDQTPPGVTVLAPQTTEIYGGSVPLRLTVNDVSSEIQSVEYQIDQSGTWSAMPLINGYYETEVTLSNGTHQVQFRASDLWSNVTVTTIINFEVDNLAPVITISTPQNGLKTNQPVTLAYIVEDDHLSQSIATVNGQVVHNGDVITADGGYQLVISATDSVGNHAEKTSIFIIDTIAPDLLVEQPLHNSQINTTIIPVTGQSEPDATVYLTVGSQSYTTQVNASGYFEFLDILLEPGINLLSLYAEDELGNASATQLIQVELMLAEELTGVVWHDSNSNQVRDFGEAALSNVSVKLTDLSTQNETTVYTDNQGVYTFSSLSEGDYILLVTDELSVLDGWRNTTNNNPAQVQLTNTAAQSINFGFTDVELLVTVNQEHDRGRLLVLLDEEQPLINPVQCDSVKSWSVQIAVNENNPNAVIRVELYDTNDNLIQSEVATIQELSLNRDYPVDHEINAHIDQVLNHSQVNLVVEKLQLGYLNVLVEATESNDLTADYYVKVIRENEVVGQSDVVSYQCSQLLEADMQLGAQVGDFVLSSLLTEPQVPSDEPFGPNNSPNLASQRLLLENLLHQYGWSYTLTTDIDMFTTEFESGQYLTYLILSEVHKLPQTLLTAMEEAHEHGDGIFMAGAHDNRNKPLFDLLGIKQQGKHNQIAGVELFDSTIHAATEIELNLDEKPLKVSLQGATSAGVFAGTNGNDNANIALTYIETLLENSESSRGVFASFDVLLQATYLEAVSEYSNILINSLIYLQDNLTAAQLGKAQALQLRLQNMATEISGQVYISLPAGTTLVASSHDIMTDNQLQWVVYELDEYQEIMIEFWFVITESPQVIELQIKADPDGRVIETLSYELVAE